MVEHIINNRFVKYSIYIYVITSMHIFILFNVELILSLPHTNALLQGPYMQLNSTMFFYVVITL